MPLTILRNNICDIEADAIVNPSDIYLSGSGGTDYEIRQRAGAKLDEELNAFGTIEISKAIITKSYNLTNCRYIIHTAGPFYSTDDSLLYDTYINCLNLAKENGLESIAFPLIASGHLDWPKGEALKIANRAIIRFLEDNDMDVYLLVYDKQSFDTSKGLFKNVIDYLQEREAKKIERNNVFGVSALPNVFHDEKKSRAIPEPEAVMLCEEAAYDKFELDESFSECLFRYIDEKGMDDVECYRKANIDRRLFSKIRNSNYTPSKETAVALAIALKLNLNETNNLLEKAGYVLSGSKTFDVIIRYCILHKQYDIFEINNILFYNDQKTLGNV